jgi:hypothetical protein
LYFDDDGVAITIFRRPIFKLRVGGKWPHYCSGTTGEETPFMRRHYDFWSVLVITITLMLFAVALVLKGFTHDILLETGVFLISVKLILMSYKNSVLAVRTEEHLQQIHALLRSMKDETRA